MRFWWLAWIEVQTPQSLSGSTQTVQNFSQLDADGGPTLPKTKTDGALPRESLYNKDCFICFGIKTHEVEDHKGWPVACCWPTDSAAAADTVIRFLGWH